MNDKPSTYLQPLFFTLVGCLLSYVLLAGFRNGYEVCTLALFWFSLFLFIQRMNHSIPFKELLAFVAVIQWLIGPTLMYRTGNLHPIYRMFISEEQYMEFALFGTFFFCLGLWSSFHRKQEETTNNQLREKLFSSQLWSEKTGRILVFVGLAVFFTPGMQRLGFIHVLLTQVMFIGGIMLVLINWKRNGLWLLMCIFALVRQITTSFSFHSTFLWLVVLVVFLSWKNNWSFGKRLMCVLVGGFFVVLIQGVKDDFRQEGRDKQNLELILFEKSLQNIESSSTLLNEKTLIKQLPRFNQGGIISRVMYHTPKEEPFANGATIVETFKAVLLPRFLAPDKKKSGGQENYERFTGFKLREGTSMNISPLGEFYVNYGTTGKYWIMLYGLFISLCWWLFYKYAAKNISMFFWLPLFFFQALKAETDILTPMNHLFKASIIIFVFYRWILPNAKYFSRETPIHAKT